MNFLNNKKLRKFRLKGTKVNKKKLNFGFYGLIALETGRLDLFVLKSFVTILKQKLKVHRGKMWFYLNNSIPVTQIPIGTRMGKGKGSIVRHIAFVRKGQILCEISISDQKLASDILKIAASKLPVKSRIVTY